MYPAGAPRPASPGRSTGTSKSSAARSGSKSREVLSYRHDSGLAIVSDGAAALIVDSCISGHFLQLPGFVSADGNRICDKMPQALAYRETSMLYILDCKKRLEV
jgi:hypothetical protein